MEGLESERSEVTTASFNNVQTIQDIDDSTVYLRQSSQDLAAMIKSRPNSLRSILQHIVNLLRAHTLCAQNRHELHSASTVCHGLPSLFCFRERIPVSGAGPRRATGHREIDHFWHSELCGKSRELCGVAFGVSFLHVICRVCCQLR
jgi:hypothetical protein